jgi:hypothetical protein
MGHIDIAYHPRLLITMLSAANDASSPYDAASSSAPLIGPIADHLSLAGVYMMWHENKKGKRPMQPVAFALPAVPQIPPTKISVGGNKHSGKKACSRKSLEGVLLESGRTVIPLTTCGGESC